MKLQQYYIKQPKTLDKFTNKVDIITQSSTSSDLQRKNKLLNKLVDEISDENTLYVEKNKKLKKQLEELKQNKPFYSTQQGQLLIY